MYSDKKLGLFEAVSMALGGMIGGGVFAVLGVIAQVVHSAAWFAFFVAGVVAFSGGYSYCVLNRIVSGNGAAVTFVQSLIGNSTLAGMTGWTLLFGYIGSIAMYAYAFGIFFTGLIGLEICPVLGVPMRPFVSFMVIAIFVGINILGAKSTGLTEEILVFLKIGILLVFGIWGMIFGANHGELEFGFSHLFGLKPLMAAAVSFVAFQGWQLLFYDQEAIKDPKDTIRKAVNISIPTATIIYVIVAITTLSLAPLSIIANHPERALAVAAEPFMGQLGFILISLAALFSTGSAINATLFSSGYFAKGMISKDFLPDRVGDSSKSGIPTRTVIFIGTLTAVFAWFGSLNNITSFASIAFIIVFGGISYLAFTQRHKKNVSSVIPVAGISGVFVFLPLLFWHLYQSKPNVFYSVLILSVAVILIELFYFEREILIEEIEEIEQKRLEEFD